MSSKLSRTTVLWLDRGDAEARVQLGRGCLRLLGPGAAGEPAIGVWTSIGRQSIITAMGVHGTLEAVED